jgi:predicted transcriptional regulator
MKVRRIKEILDAEVLCGEKSLDNEINMGCGCDLMSHVLAHVHHESTLLLTGLATPQVIYTTDAVDIPVICFVRGKKPDDDTVKLAQDREMILLFTQLPLFESCGRLYKEGLIGCSEYEG